MVASSTFADALQVFSKVSYFSGLDKDSLQKVIQSAFRQTYTGDQLVILEGDPSPGLYVVQSGWLKAVKIAVDGREQVLQLLGPGEAFNAISVFTETISPATVSALEESVVWMVRREAMLRLLDGHPRLARQVIQDLAGRVLHLITLVEDLSLRSVEARTARLLVEQAEDGIVERKRWATQSEMAARLGTVPDVLNRVLRRLVEGGILQVDRQRILILDMEQLKALALAP